MMQRLKRYLRRGLFGRRGARGAAFATLRLRLLTFLAIFGPGFITANVDNDPGGILTYSQAGAKFGCIAVDSNRLWFRWGPTSAGTSTQGSHKILRLISKGGR